MKSKEDIKAIVYKAIKDHLVVHIKNKENDRRCRIDMLAEDIARMICEEETEKEEQPILIGKLTRKYGEMGYRTAEVGTLVYEFKEKYFIVLVSENGEKEKRVSFYKNTLKPDIDFLEK